MNQTPFLLALRAATRRVATCPFSWSILEQLSIPTGFPNLSLVQSTGGYLALCLRVRAANCHQYESPRPFHRDSVCKMAAPHSDQMAGHQNLSPPSSSKHGEEAAGSVVKHRGEIKVLEPLWSARIVEVRQLYEEGEGKCGVRFLRLAVQDVVDEEEGADAVAQTMPSQTRESSPSLRYKGGQWVDFFIPGMKQVFCLHSCPCVSFCLVWEAIFDALSS